MAATNTLPIFDGHNDTLLSLYKEEQRLTGSLPRTATKFACRRRLTWPTRSM